MGDQIRPDEMAKPSKTSASLTSSSSSVSTLVSRDLPPEHVKATEGFLAETGIYSSLSDHYNFKDSYSHLVVSNLFKVNNIQRGRISCVLSVLPAVTNIYNGLFGGAIGAIAERLAIACARTVVPEDKQLFLGELSMSYLSAAQQNEVVMVDASVARSGRNISVVAMEFRIKESLKLVYTARVTLYHLPVAKL